MKKRLLPLVALFISGFAYSQVGIGTLTPSKSAELEVHSSDKGLLIPNVNLKSIGDKTTIKNGPVPSLLVYNTNVSNKELVLGYYFWKDDKWNLLISQVDLPDAISNNVENIFNNPITKNFLENLIKNTGGDVSFDGTTFTYKVISTDAGGNPVKDANGNVVKEIKTITVKELVGKGETPTKIEANADGTYTYYNEEDTKYVIDIPASVIKKFNEIINKDEIQKILNKYITENAIHNVTFDGDTFSYIDKDGKVQTIDIDKIVKANETKTTILESTTKPGIYVYTSEKGTFNIDIPASVIKTFKEIIKDKDFINVLNKYITENAIHNVTFDGNTFSYIDKDGKVQTIDIDKIVKANETKTTILESTTKPGIYVYTSEKGTFNIDIPASVIKTFKEIIKDKDFINVLNKYITENAIHNVTFDGNTFSYIDKDGKVQTIDIDKIVKANETKTTILESTTKPGVYVYTSEKGTFNIDIPASVIKTFKEIIKDKDFINVLNKYITENAINNVTFDGNTFSYIDKDGNVQTIDIKKIVRANETPTRIDANADGTYTYYNEKDTKYVIDIPASVIKKFNEIINKDEIQKILNEYITKNAIHNVTFDGDTFSYIDKDGNVQTIDIKKIVKANETLTTLVVKDEDKKDNITGKTYKEYSLVYTDEEDTPHTIDISTLIGQNETVTSLIYNPATHSLEYKDENLDTSIFKLIDLVGETQTLTTLKLDVDNKKLTYTDENKKPHNLDLAPIIQEPWYSVETRKGAIKNTDNLYTKGWVGIGFDRPSDLPDEKLRVNGAITAVNSYYADYVFEDYFDGFSNIKYDYKFKDLNTVEDFIKTNRHLPGITPINELKKTDEGYSFNVSELSIQLLEKTEELYLHIIEQKKENDQKIQQIQKSVEESNKAMQERLDKLERLLIKTLEN